jgi:hypothetical protein
MSAHFHCHHAALLLSRVVRDYRRAEIEMTVYGGHWQTVDLSTGIHATIVHGVHLLPPAVTATVRHGMDCTHIVEHSGFT